MILKIYPIDGEPDVWEEGTFDTWGISDDNKIFIVKDKKWVGVYHFERVEKIIVAKEEFTYGFQQI